MNKKAQDRSEASDSVTIRSVAKLAKVSIATVSRFLNQNGYVGADSALRIRSAMDELDYVPNTSARNLASSKTWTIGLLLEHIAGDFFTPLFKGIEAEASEAGYSLVTVSTAPWKDLGAKNPPLGPHNTDGILVFADGLPEAWAERWNQSGFPMVFIQQEPPAGSSLPSVHVENTQAVREAVRHLIEAHGRRRIAFLRGQIGQKDSGEREAGYEAAIAEAGLELLPELMLEGGFDTEIACASVGAALEAGLAFDAICAADDDSAIGALRAMRERGIRVPEDVSLIGFDDQEYCTLVDPSLSTIRAPTEAVARAATRALLALFRGEEPKGRVVLPSEVICRRSCGCSKR
jgi:LacI family transcriptional regulator